MTALHERLPPSILVDLLAQEIRRVDGSHSLGAAALAEALMPFLAAQSLQALEGGDTMRGVCESADFEADTLTFRMVGAYYAAAGEYVITPAAPSPSAALQAGEV